MEQSYMNRPDRFDEQSVIGEVSMNFSELTQRLFELDPLPPRSISFGLEEDSNSTSSSMIPKLLGQFLITGAQMRYHKPELGLLTPEEVEGLRKYLHSIGWDFDYTVQTLNLPGGYHKYHYQIVFKGYVGRV